MKKAEDTETLKRRQKRLAILVFLLLALFLLALFGFLRLLRQLSPEVQTPAKADSLSDYLAEQWPDYAFVSYDAQENVLTVRGQAKIRYAQAQDYGVAVYDETMLRSYTGTAAGIAAGMKLDCGIEGCTVVLQQYSSDDRLILTASSDGSVQACWDQDAP